MIDHARHQDTAPRNLAAATLTLLGDHLDAALAHCEAIEMAQVTLGASVASGASVAGIVRQHRTLAAFVDDLRARELAVALRLTQACVVADQASGLSDIARPIAALVKSGAAVLVETGIRLAREARDVSEFDYLADRGLLPLGTSVLPDGIFGTDRFVVLGVMPLAAVQTYLGAALDAIDALGPART